jgi:hypothetical protein
MASKGVYTLGRSGRKVQKSARLHVAKSATLGWGTRRENDKRRKRRTDEGSVMTYRDSSGILLLAVVFAIACGYAVAQDQSNQAPPNQVPPNQVPPNQPPAPQPHEQPGAQQTPPAQSPESSSENPASKPEQQEQPKKDDSPNPAQAAAEKTKEVTIEAAEATKKLGQETLVKVRDWETEWLVGAYVSRNRPMEALSTEGREDIYLHQTFLTPGAYLKRVFDAGIDQARGSPPQWGGGWGGYTARFASREGQFFAANSLAALGDAKLHYEPRYDQCKCQGFWPRTRHAIARNFLTYNETEQEMRPQLALYGGAFGGGLISTAWKPKPRNAFAEGGRAMLGQAAWGALENLFTEFALDINRKLGAKK